MKALLPFVGVAVLGFSLGLFRLSFPQRWKAIRQAFRPSHLRGKSIVEWPTGMVDALIVFGLLWIVFVILLALGETNPATLWPLSTPGVVLLAAGFGFSAYCIAWDESSFHVHRLLFPSAEISWAAIDVVEVHDYLLFEYLLIFPAKTRLLDVGSRLSGYVEFRDAVHRHVKAGKIKKCGFRS